MEFYLHTPSSFIMARYLRIGSTFRPTLFCCVHCDSGFVVTLMPSDYSLWIWLHSSRLRRKSIYCLHTPNVKLLAEIVSIIQLYITCSRKEFCKITQEWQMAVFCFGTAIFILAAVKRVQSFSRKVSERRSC